MLRSGMWGTLMLKRKVHTATSVFLWSLGVSFSSVTKWRSEVRIQVSGEQSCLGA